MKISRETLRIKMEARYIAFTDELNEIWKAGDVEKMKEKVAYIEKRRASVEKNGYSKRFSIYFSCVVEAYYQDFKTTIAA